MVPAVEIARDEGQDRRMIAAEFEKELACPFDLAQPRRRRIEEVRSPAVEVQIVNAYRAVADEQIDPDHHSPLAHERQEGRTGAQNRMAAEDRLALTALGDIAQVARHKVGIDRPGLRQNGAELVNL